MRFFHTTDPAITRKRSIEGVAIKSDAKLRVASIEPLGLELPMYDITTGTGDFIANGVVSHNCFARNTHTYLDLDAGQDFDYQGRGQGQRAASCCGASWPRRGWARRAHRDGHQRRLLPARRGPLPADAGHHRRAARRARTRSRS